MEKLNIRRSCLNYCHVEDTKSKIFNCSYPEVGLLLQFSDDAFDENGVLGFVEESFVVIVILLPKNSTIKKE